MTEPTEPTVEAAQPETQEEPNRPDLPPESWPAQVPDDEKASDAPEPAVQPQTELPPQ